MFVPFNILNADFTENKKIYYIIFMSYGKYTYGQPLVPWHHPNAKLIIGNFCSIAKNCNIYI